MIPGSSRTIGRSFSIACFFLAGALPALGAEPVANARPAWALLKKYCVECHGHQAKEAGIDFLKIVTRPPAEHRKLWEKVRDNLASRGMPPRDRDQPADQERDDLVQWIDQTALAVDCQGAANPGRVTIRRLNRQEYNNTIRDLCQIDFRPADDFPADDVGYGFDNIGDVLSLPPLLLEKYLAAAEAIVDQSVIVPQPQLGPSKRYECEVEQAEGMGQRFDDWGYQLITNGEVFVRHAFPKSGEYVLRVRVAGQQAGDEPCRMSFRLDGKEVKRFDVPATVAAPAVYETRIRVPEGAKRVAAAYLNDYWNPKAPDPNNRDRNMVFDYLEIQGPIDDRPPVLPESHKQIVFLTPKGGNEARVAEEILQRFATRAYRRPATEDEVARLLELFRDASEAPEATFETALRLPLKAVLCSPHFLFRVELDGASDRPDGSFPLGEYELASRLSYFLWSSMPDDELLQLAGQNRLRKELPRQVARMLQDAKSDALVKNFAGQWLQLRSLERLAPDPERFPQFDEALRAAMTAETETFFRHIMRENRPLLELLDADYSFLNERLARHYGVEGVRGPELRQVQLTDRRRGGILTQASILTVTSNPTRTSPVKRGKWVLENLLGAPPPPPPPGAGDLPEGDGSPLTGTVRQRMEQHRQKPACASCHARLDPLGFGLENFDAIGSWRAMENGAAIDASGELPDGARFDGPAELRTILVGKQDQFFRCFTEKLLTYALGRGLEYFDKCAVDQIVDAAAKDKFRFQRVVVAVVQSDPFQRARARSSK